MKVKHLLESFDDHFRAPEPKLKKLKAAITPELLVKHYDKIIHVLAAKVPSQLIDVIISELSGNQTESTDIEFNMKLMLKAFSSDPEIKSAEIKKSFIDGKHDALLVRMPSYAIKRKITSTPHLFEVGYGFWYQVWFDKAKWVVLHKKAPSDMGRTMKRFETPRETLDYLKKKIAKDKKVIEKLKSEGAQEA